MEFKAFATDNALPEARKEVYDALSKGATVLFRRSRAGAQTLGIVAQVSEECENFKTIYTDKGSFTFSKISCCYSAPEVGVLKS